MPNINAEDHSFMEIVSPIERTNKFNPIETTSSSNPFSLFIFLYLSWYQSYMLITAIDLHQEVFNPHECSEDHKPSDTIMSSQHPEK